jgi:hypothetical protein
MYTPCDAGKRRLASHTRALTRLVELGRGRGRGHRRGCGAAGRTVRCVCVRGAARSGGTVRRDVVR